MASVEQRTERIRKEIARRGLIAPKENLLTKDNLSNDERRELWRRLLTLALPGWMDGAAMFPDDTELADLVSNGTELLQAINRGDSIDFMPKPDTVKYGYKGQTYETEAEMDAAYQADAIEDSKRNSIAYKLKQQEAGIHELEG